MGSPLTRPPTTRPCYRTCPSGAPWPVGKQTVRSLSFSSIRKEWSRLRSHCLWIMPQVGLFGWRCRDQHATSFLPSNRLPTSSNLIRPSSNCPLEYNGNGKWSNSSIKVKFPSPVQNTMSDRRRCLTSNCFLQSFSNHTIFRWIHRGRLYCLLSRFLLPRRSFLVRGIFLSFSKLIVDSRSTKVALAKINVFRWLAMACELKICSNPKSVVINVLTQHFASATKFYSTYLFFLIRIGFNKLI